MKELHRLFYVFQALHYNRTGRDEQLAARPMVSPWPNPSAFVSVEPDRVGVAHTEALNFKIYKLVRPF